jgi:hypothetical protein
MFPTFVRNFLQALQGPDVVQGVDGGREAAVQAKDLPVHQRGQREIVDQVREVVPDLENKNLLPNILVQ